MGKPFAVQLYDVVSFARTSPLKNSPYVLGHHAWKRSLKEPRAFYNASMITYLRSYIFSQ